MVIIDNSNSLVNNLSFNIHVFYLLLSIFFILNNVYECNFWYWPKPNKLLNLNFRQDFKGISWKLTTMKKTKISYINMSDKRTSFGCLDKKKIDKDKRKSDRLEAETSRKWKCEDWKDAEDSSTALISSYEGVSDKDVIVNDCTITQG